jgi:CHAT domain-containing protein
MLLETDLVSKRKLAAAMTDQTASFSSQFGGDLAQIVAFDNYSRLLQQAGYRLAARVVTENLARLAKSQPDVPSWSSWAGMPPEARMQQAQVLGAVHARMARYAFEDNRWVDANAELDEAMSLMTSRLRREWQFGNERAVLLYRKMQPALRLSAQLRFLLAVNDKAAKAIPNLRERALEDLQFAMLGETALTMQSAARKRIYGSGEIAVAVERRDDAADRLEQLDALERAMPSKLPWVIDERRQDARAALEQAIATIEGRLSAPEELVSLRSLDRLAIEAALEPDEAVVVLHSGSGNLYGFALRPGRDPVLYVSKVGSAALSDMVAKLRREGASFGAVDTGNARQLFDHLLAPADAILNDAGHVIVVGDGPVPAIPFAMLVTGDAVAAGGDASPVGSHAVRGATPLQMRGQEQGNSLEAVPWLIRRYPVSVAPSIASIVAQRATPGPTAARKPFFGVGDPFLRGSAALASVALDTVYTRSGQVDGAALANLAPLPETARELRDLAAALGASGDDLLLGRAATRSNVLNAPLSQFQVLAFATHGVLAGEINGVSEPGLVLSPEQESDGSAAAGYLPLSDILAMKLDADMIILSACNTGGADGRPRAEAMSGLARGFISAGARQLMVTLWAIPSDPTTRLTTGTVAALETHGANRWPKAMRDSILAMIDQPATATDRHPASWAAFTILGVGGGANH